MVRMEGKKVVAIATFTTLATIAVAQIYLPFYANRDMIRGMSEEEDMPKAAKREMDLEIMRQERQQQQQQQRNNENNNNNNGAAGSMWKNFRK
mmetsp:Transcript_12142/g.13919  ORF Transcript_12142/g.13919 Transcript_12142/m.13919 type:complete len:93 (+) Transcript_12142:152-430(+)|eukprot:CAMPEP_0194150180 /NCGR_PEP_ID=MMETSP0152-20130528/41911_1 /TAXON_ID=1049557 /ORGANISM="Thalassiothrix antarctica, Strain L6-D1" /LENGTH=92 /DNA_ID=CAMNT_0038852911 /DNA_START=74 /DNA_END=352 /DNA_ORIENTATION=+